MSEELKIHFVAYSRYSSGVTKKARKSLRGYSTFRITNTILVSPRHMTVTVICALHLLHIEKEIRVIVMT